MLCESKHLENLPSTIIWKTNHVLSELLSLGENVGKQHVSIVCWLRLAMFWGLGAGRRDKEKMRSEEN